MLRRYVIKSAEEEQLITAIHLRVRNVGSKAT